MSYEELDRKEKELKTRLEKIKPNIRVTQREDLIGRAIVTMQHKINRLQGIQYLLDQNDFTLIKWIGDTPAPFEI